MEHVTDGCQCEGKRCRKCEQTLCKGCFAKHKRQREGLNSRCRTCQNSYLALYRQKKGLSKKVSRDIHVNGIHTLPNSPQAKKCAKCKEIKPLEAFSLNRTKRDGLRETCKVCESQRRKPRKNGEAYNEKQRAWLVEHKAMNSPEYQAYKKRRNKNNQTARKRKQELGIKQPRYMYGIGEYKMSIQDYNATFEAQNGCCAICGNPETVRNQHAVRRLAIDHDHQTGKIRGLLCHHCNLALGYFREDIDVMEHAIAYLHSYQGSLKIGDVSL